MHPGRPRDETGAGSVLLERRHLDGTKSEKKGGADLSAG